MVPCIVLGDSIAVGVGQYRPDCVTIAQGGITSERYVGTMLSRQDADTVIISLGVNDDDTVDTASNLRTLRDQVHAGTVYWLLPGIKEQVREVIRGVAGAYGDRLIDTRPYAGPDHLHPSGPGYIALARLSAGAAPVATAQPAATEPALPTVYVPGGPRFRTFRFWSIARNPRFVALAGHQWHRAGRHSIGWLRLDSRSYRIAAQPAGWREPLPEPPIPPARHGHAAAARAVRPAFYVRTVTCLRRAAGACITVFRPERG